MPARSSPVGFLAPTTGLAELGVARSYAARSYTVRYGDSIHSIAARTRVDYRDIASWNNIVSPYRLRTGQVLRLTSPDGRSGFRWGVYPAPAWKLPYSYHSGCPVTPSRLRILHLYHLGFDGRVHTGRMVVVDTRVSTVVRVFNRLYNARFPIQRMRLVDDYRGSDDASMAANNTSAFNCRAVTGGRSWSQHSYGNAIDINPVQNPYVRGSTVLPSAGRSYLNRTGYRTGMILANGVADRAFAAEGWRWGGDWRSPKDYQHFSPNGR